MLVYSGVLAVFLASGISGKELLKPGISLLSLLAVVLALPLAGKAAKIIGVIFLAAGTLAMWSQDVPAPNYVLAFGEMLYILVLMAVMPLLAIPIRVGQYDRIFQHWFSAGMKSAFQAYRMLTMIAYFLGSFLNLATLPITYYSVKSSVNRLISGDVSRFLTVGIVNGFSLPIIWTPLAATVGIVLDMTGLSWLAMFPGLILFSLAGLLFHLLLFYVLHRFARSSLYEFRGLRLAATGTGEQAAAVAGTAAGDGTAALPDSAFPTGDVSANGQPADDGDMALDNKELRNKFLQVAAVIVLLISLIVILSEFFSVGLVAAVAVLTVPLSWIWAALIGRAREFCSEAKIHISSHIPEMSDMFVIFICAGFFANAIQFAGLDNEMNHLLLAMNHVVGVKVFLTVLPLLILLMSFTAIHPMVTIALLAQSLKPEVLGLTAEELTFAMLGGAVLTFMIGPFSGTLGVMSSMVHRTTFQMVRWNAVYALGFYVLLAVLLMMI
jgi:hypothetical protein